MNVNNIILIDDDSISNLINQYIINACVPNHQLLICNSPLKGLECVMRLLNDNNSKSIVLLDIRMPELSGWELLDQLKPFANALSQNFRIYMLSSSIDPKDLRRANKHELVTGFFEKPLTAENMMALSKIDF